MNPFKMLLYPLNESIPSANYQLPVQSSTASSSLKKENDDGNAPARQSWSGLVPACRALMLRAAVFHVTQEHPMSK